MNQLVEARGNPSCSNCRVAGPHVFVRSRMASQTVVSLSELESSQTFLCVCRVRTSLLVVTRFLKRPFTHCNLKLNRFQSCTWRGREDGRSNPEEKDGGCFPPGLPFAREVSVDCSLAG